MAETSLEQRALEFALFITAYATKSITADPEMVKNVTKYAIDVLKIQERATKQACIKSDIIDDYVDEHEHCINERQSFQTAEWFNKHKIPFCLQSSALMKDIDNKAWDRYPERMGNIKKHLEG